MGNFLNNLADRIWSTASFQNDYTSLHAASVTKSLMGTPPSDIPTLYNTYKLLQSAVTFAGTQKAEYRQAAYRIAIDSFNLYGDEFTNLPNVLHVIFGRLGNFPAVDHLYRVLNTDKQYTIPSSALYELLLHESNNTVSSVAGDIVLTDFQRGLWSALETKKEVSVSAPTSAGKSFALQQYIIKSLLHEHIQFVLYMVPTRALIHQVSDAINERLPKDILVSTIPQTPAELGMDCGVFVLTQERTHVLLEASPDLQFQMVVLDEAQTIGDGARGVLLQVIIERLLRNNPQAKFFFGSPFSRNPEHFNYLFDGNMCSVKETSSPVSQNLIFADIDTIQSKKLSLSLFNGVDSSSIMLSNIQLEDDVHGDEHILAYLSYRLGRQSKNLIYSGSPAKCEDIADKIRQWVESKSDDAEPNDNLAEFATLVREHIHKDYLLADMIEHGIVFHYGKMPTLIRKAIEYYFTNNDEMHFLVCTSTLLHGVNLPAKNLFILKPSEGNKWLTRNATPMGSTSFWNLAGRAGRLGKDFEGNVFLVNKAQWENDPTEGAKEQIIKSSLYDTIGEHHDSIIRFASDEDIDADNQTKQKIESVFVKLFCDYRQGRLNDVLARSPITISDQFADSFSEACSQLSFDVPIQIIEENVCMSPFRQQRMLDYIQNAINEHDYEKLIPPHPQQNNPYQGYARLLSRFERYFDGDGNTPASGRPKYLAVIAMAWMRGMPYPHIIQKSIDKNPNKALPSLIRDLMDTIENQLRFKTVQQTRCYIGLLCHAFKANGLSDLCPSIPSIPLYLELGACSGTMVNLIGLGISRTTAGLLNNKAANRSMDRGQCIAWLLRENWEASDLPKVCITEVRNILAGKSK